MWSTHEPYRKAELIVTINAEEIEIKIANSCWIIKITSYGPVRDPLK